MRIHNTLLGALALGLVAVSPLAISGSAIAQEAATAAKVVSQPAAQVDITIFGSSYAQVEETRRIELKQGVNSVLLTGVAAQYKQNSLRLVGVKNGAGVLTIKSSTYQPATLTTERLLELSVGKKITVATSGVGGKSYSGELLSTQGGNLILKSDNGTIDVVQGGNVTFHEAPAGLTATPSLVMEVAADKAGTYDVTFIYETGGFGWAANHSAILDEAASKLKSWESSVLITNESGSSFANATVRLISGRVVENEEAAGGARMYSAAKAVRSDSAQVEDVGEQKTYILPGKVSLGNGQARLVPLFTASNVPVKRTYVVPATAPYRGITGGFASVRLTVDNCLRDNMGKAIPQGVVKLYQFNTDGNLLQTGTARTTDRAVNEVFDLNVGKASDIKYEVKTVTSKKLAKVADEQRSVENTVEVTVFNYKSQPVLVQLELQASTAQLDKAWTVKSTDSATIVTSVAGNGQSTVRYVVVVPDYGN